MPLGKRTLILGEGRIAEKLQDQLIGSGIVLDSVYNLEQAGFEKFKQLSGVVYCVSKTSDVEKDLNRIGQLYSRCRSYSKRLLDLIVLSDKPDWEINVECGVTAEKKFPLRIRYLSIPSIAARCLLRKYPLHLSADVAFGQAIHVLIVGFSDLGKALAVHIMRLAHFGLEGNKLTIVDRNPEQCRNLFLVEFPEAENIATLDFIDIDSSNLASLTPVTSVYICLTDSLEKASCIDTFTESVQKKFGGGPPVFREVPDFQASDDISDWDGQNFPYSALSEVCVAEVLFGERGDELAGIVHEYYRDSIAAQGRSLVGTPAGEPWESLDESYRQASRHQADHMLAKTVTIDCRFVLEAESEFFVFYPREVEKLARIEHDRWSADRYLNGWKYGPVRDNEKKFHPELIPYDDLTEDMKDLDRYTVRLMPALLGRNGLAIKRNLIIAIINEFGSDESDSAFVRSLDAILKRLKERYQDRALVLAIDILDKNHRKVAGYARKNYGAVLWSFFYALCDFKAEESERVRTDILELLAHSERRFSFSGAEEGSRWVYQRADIVLILGHFDQQNLSAASPGIDLSRGAGFTLSRHIKLDPVSGATGWSFEY